MSHQLWCMCKMHKQQKVFCNDLMRDFCSLQQFRQISPN